jgi:hypothetical protein
METQLIEIRGKIAKKKKDQLRIKLKKFVVNDHFEKDVELWGCNWLKLELKLKRFKSLMTN